LSEFKISDGLLVAMKHFSSMKCWRKTIEVRWCVMWKTEMGRTLLKKAHQTDQEKFNFSANNFAQK